REITLTWVKHPDPHVKVYHISRSLDPTSMFTYHNGLAEDKTSYTDKNLINGQTYYYKIWVSTDAGYTSVTSEIVSATSEFSGLSTPENFTALGGDNQVLLHWEDSPEPEVTNYHIVKGEEINGMLNYLIGLNGNTTSYTDNDVVNEHTYYYSIWATDAQGRTSSRSEVISGTPTGLLGLDDFEAGYNLPERYVLQQNYANPFNSSTTIYYTLPERTDVLVTIYNMLGRQICGLEAGTKDPGLHSVQWNGLDDSDNPAVAGIYLYQIQAGQFVQTRKLVLLK
ncbi:MAG: T9SS type A sorting domain-containing protein, partial [Candidatus Neomarinimicrobiota bacterium]